MAGKTCTPLLMRGDIVSLELDDGRTLELPEDWGLLHDTEGTCVNRCDLLICRYRRLRTNAPPSHPKTDKSAQQYFGSGAKLHSGAVDLPSGPWKRVGRVVAIYYQRDGELSGYYHHPFKQPVVLYKQKRGSGYRLHLPDRCVVDERGFVWP